MNIASLTPSDLRTALRGGLGYLELNRTLLDRLNVFPVPDGDTGSNMASTFAAGIDYLDSGSSESIAELGISFNSELTRSSRGNSGFILARFFHGFFESAAKGEQIDSCRLAECVANGSFSVNGALFSPTEGTMISILAAFASSLGDYTGNNIIEALRSAEDAGTRALFHTPAQLPVLARAGVVDSGALGLLFILRGMIASLTDCEFQLENESDYRFEPDTKINVSDDSESRYRFCTEAVVVRNDTEDKCLKSWLKTVGDSIALVCEDQMLKIHIHTNNPEDIFNRLSRVGTITRRKVDDMKEQSRLISAAGESDDGSAVLAFVPGEGFQRIFEDLGITNCFVYGSILPAPEEIIEALSRIESRDIIVLPNNSNILPSVMASRELTGKNVTIIPTTNIIQGITVSYGYSADDGVLTNTESMNSFLDTAVGLFVYRCTMDTKFGNINLNEGDWFVTLKDEIVGCAPDAAAAISESMRTLDTTDFTDIAIFRGDGFDPRNSSGIVRSIADVLPDIEIVEHFGGQTKAALIISLE